VLGFTREWERGTFFITGKKKSKDFQSCLPILPAYLPLKFPNGQFPLKIPGPISQAKLKPMRKKKCPLKKNIQNCLPILPAYLPLKFPNGQFPLKIPGPISQAKLKPMKKKNCPLKKNSNGEVAILLKNRLWLI
jgi:uncharacterized protein YijF (DUF1287 family)